MRTLEDIRNEFFEIEEERVKATVTLKACNARIDELCEEWIQATGVVGKESRGRVQWEESIDADTEDESTACDWNSPAHMYGEEKEK